MTVENEHGEDTTPNKPEKEAPVTPEADKVGEPSVGIPSIPPEIIDAPPIAEGENPPVPSKDIYLRQENESSGNSTQENKANLFINKSKASIEAGIVLKVTQLNTQNEREKPIFNELEKKDYLTNLDVTTSSYLNYITDKYCEHFYSDRIIVINNTTNQEMQSMAAVQLLMSSKESNHKADFFTYNLAICSFSLQQVLYDFKEKNKKKEGVHFLILNNTNCDFSRSYSNIESVLNHSAEQNSAIKTLRESYSYLIIFTKHAEWYGKVVKSGCTLPIININNIHHQIWASSIDKEQYEALMPSIEIALADYDWLSDIASDQKYKVIADYISTGKLECIVEDYIEKSTNEELNTINNLIKEPINKIALFNIAYFSGATIGEQNAIMNAIINNIVSGDDENMLLNDWQNNADEVMASCGLAVTEDEHNIETYRFITEARRENLLTLFGKRHKIFLQNNCDVIIDRFLYNPELVSAVFIEGLCELIFISRNDNGLYLKQICLRIIDILESNEKQEEELKVLFGRLVFIIEKWQAYEKSKIYLPQLYQLLLKTAFKRSIFGAILTYICNDTHFQNLEYLKLFLEESKKDEDSPKRDIIQSILTYFQSDYTAFFQRVIDWNTNITGNHPEIVPESFHQAYTAIAVYIYENRFGNKEENQVDYKIVYNFLKDAEPHCISTLSRFLFPVNGLSILDKISRHNYEKQSIEENIIDKLQINLLYYLYATIIIRVACLCKKINTTYNLQDIIVIFLQTLKEHKYELKKIINGFRDAMNQFSIELGRETNKKKPDNQIRLTCKNSIAVAKEIIAIIYTNNNQNLI